MENSINTIEQERKSRNANAHRLAVAAGLIFVVLLYVLSDIYFWGTSVFSWFSTGCYLAGFICLLHGIRNLVRKSYSLAAAAFFGYAALTAAPYFLGKLIQTT